MKEDFIDYYLNWNNNNEYDNFDKEQKYLLKKEVFEKDDFKNCLKKLDKEFNLEIEFREIETRKYPINIRFKYYEEDKKEAQKVIGQLKEKINSNYKIKKIFVLEKIQNQELENKMNEILTLIHKKEELEKQTKILNEELNNIKNDNKKKIEDLEEQLKEKNDKIQNLEKELSDEKSKRENLITVIFKKYGDEISNLSIICNNTDNLLILKDKYFEKYPQYKNNAIFKYKDKILEDSKSLNDYNIKNNDEIFIINDQ